MEVQLSSSSSNLEFMVSGPLAESSALDIFTAASLEDINHIQSTIGGVNINSKNREGWTSLMYACFWGKEDLVSFLLMKDANIHAVDQKVRTALMIAAGNGFATIVRQLIHAGSHVESRDDEDWNALFHAIYSENLDVVCVLLTYGSNPNSCLRDSATSILMMAVAVHQTEIVKTLLKAGANQHFATISGQTAIQVAKQMNYTDILELFNSDASSDAVHCDLENLLSALDLGSYIDLFNQEQVDFSMFLSLNEEDLQKLGIIELGHRKRFVDAIARWHSNTPLSSGIEGSYAARLNGQLMETKKCYQKKYTQLNNAYQEKYRMVQRLLEENKQIPLTNKCYQEKLTQLKDAYQEKHQMVQRLLEENKQLRSALIELNNRCNGT